MLEDLDECACCRSSLARSSSPARVVRLSPEAVVTSRARLLIAGTGARRHAIARRLTTEDAEVWLAPASPVIEGPHVRAAPVSATSGAALASWAAQRVDTVLILDEALLFNGLADDFTRAAVGCLGAGQGASIIERSKIFAHVLMQTLGVTCPSWRVYGTVADTIADSGRLPYPVVIKTDGPAQRTGVFIVNSSGEARDALKLLGEREIGAGPVLVEQYVPGPEISVSVLVGGSGEMVLWPVVRQFNRSGDTRADISHGMGALAPEQVDDAVLHTVVEWLGRIAGELGHQGRAFRGWLTTDVILGPRGPELLEFNCHVVDPEVQTMLPLVGASLTELLTASAHGGLGGLVDLHRSASTTGATVNLVRTGYPNMSPGVVRIPRALAARTDIALYECVADGVDLVPMGGRVMSCTATAPRRVAAAAAARAVAATIAAALPGLSYLADIDGD
jgi:phosphoribosylamine---glycine ligase